jgi:transposase
MRGKKVLNPKLFYQFSIDKLVSENHLLRCLESFLDLSFIYERTKGLYGYNGNVSVDPVVVVKVLLLGYLYNISSVRELMRQIEDRISFRWFLGYDIDETIPTHSSISKNIKRFGPDLFEELFNRVVQQCKQFNIVGGNLVHIDSSIIKADASEDSVKLNLDEDQFYPDLAPKEYWKQITDELKVKYPNVNDRMHSSTDPDAGIISRNGKNRQLAFKDHRAVDDQHGVILSTKATSAAVTDEGQMTDIIKYVIFQQQIIPVAVAADKLYGCTDNYLFLHDQGIISYIPRSRAGKKKGIYGKERFEYLPEEDIYICPEGHRLVAQSARKTRTRLFRGSTPVCRSCQKRPYCAKGKGPRTIHRHCDEDIVESALSLKGTPNYNKAMKRRMAIIEGSFGDAKEQHAHSRSRWRGIAKMQIQCYLVATAQNIKKLLKYAWNPLKQSAKTSPHFLLSIYFHNIYVKYSVSDNNKSVFKCSFVPDVKFS